MKKWIVILFAGWILEGVGIRLIKIGYDNAGNLVTVIGFTIVFLCGTQIVKKWIAQRGLK